MKYILTLFAFLSGFHLSFSQTKVSGVVKDVATNAPLPYATLRFGNTTQGAIADIDGRFSFTLPTGVTEVHVSYAGYIQGTFSYPLPNVIKLTPAGNNMSEVVIRPPYERIKYIINRAVDNKHNNNPDKYDKYSCHVYYKMNADLQANKGADISDSTMDKLRRFIENQHVLFGETYSRRSYRKPGKLQETILASKLSGFQKTYFTNLVTAFLPFHVYEDNITLNGTIYTHPVAGGWRSRYEFNIEQELVSAGGDTTFILSYYPKKGANFNSLRGTVYINSNGYAVSHITTNSIDSNNERYMKMEQNYRLVDGKWFPAELNYDFVFTKYPSPKVGMRLSGHSIVDSVSFGEERLERFRPAYPVRLHDSVDLRTDAEWAAIRKDTLTRRETETYVFMDSVSEEMGMDKLMRTASYASVTYRIPVKFIDIDLAKLYSFNAYEKTRLGLGLYTNDRLTKYASVGGWFGYGFKDKEWKYGASARIYPTGKKEYWLEAAYLNTYQNTGNVNIHRDLDRNYYRNLLLDKVDRVEGYTFTGHARAGYLDAELSYVNQTLNPQYDYAFGAYSTLRSHKFNVEELSLNLRFAYGEKRAPVFGHYLPVGTKYPILYLDVAAGSIDYLNTSENYIRAIGAVSYKKHTNRWGADLVRAEGGLLNTADDKPLPRSFLMGANGFRAKKNYIYAYGGFVTMFPYTYFNDRYASLIYRHDFDRMLYKTKYSSPFISLAHNMIYGSLSKNNTLTNGDISLPANGYHESGLMLNRVLRVNYVNLAYLDLNIGGFYHWNGAFDLKKNGTFVVGIGFGL